MRRLLFSLLNTIAASGYHIRLFDSVPPYAQWFDLHLEHLQHCIEFDDKADLLVELNAETGAEHIAGMRQRGVDYCDDYLAPSLSSTSSKRASGSCPSAR